MPLVTANAIDTKKSSTFSIGILIALSSWALVFVTLIWGYVVFRLRAVSWPHDHMTAQVQGLAILNTIIVGLSTLCLTMGLKKSNRVVWLWAAFGLGVTFLVGQVLLWKLILVEGHSWQSSIAGSFFFLLTGFHFLHIAGALPVLLFLCLSSNPLQRTSLIRSIKYFWDLLFYLWIVLYVLIFIIK
jgi:heme/copper-type cytochrome/quinol oxidase subunit 3